MCLKVLYRLKFYLHETIRMAFIVVISLLESKNTTAARVTLVKNLEREETSENLTSHTTISLS